MPWRRQAGEIGVASRQKIINIWLVPVLLALITFAGLTAALLDDGLGDWIAWLALAIPVGIGAWGMAVQAAGWRR